MIRNLQLSHVQDVGYANMRCTWVLGCPGEIHPSKAITKLEAAFEPNNDRANTEAAYAQAFEELFPGEEIPDQVGIQCGAQFALAKWKVLERPKSDYIRYREWLLRTPLPDNVSGRIMEYAWHSMFPRNRQLGDDGLLYDEVRRLTKMSFSSDHGHAIHLLPTCRTVFLRKVRPLQSHLYGRYVRKAIYVTQIRNDTTRMARRGTW